MNHPVIASLSPQWRPPFWFSAALNLQRKGLTLREIADRLNQDRAVVECHGSFGRGTTNDRRRTTSSA